MQEILQKSYDLFENTIIERKRYYKRLESLLTTKQIVVIQGQRRVGKSFVTMGYLKSLGIAKEKIFFFNKELDSYNAIKTSEDLARLYDSFVEQYGVPSYIFVDEVQDIQEWERFIRAKYTEGKQYVIISGSNAHLLASDLTTYLSGRFVTLEVFPLEYEEYLQFTQQNHSTETIKNYYSEGGLPEIALMKNPIDKLNYTKNVLAAIVMKDILTRYKVQDPPFFEKILRVLADCIGSPISLRNLKNTSQVYGRDTPTLNTLNTYLDHLQSAYIIHHAERFDIHGKKLLEFNGKYYFNDIGLRNALALNMNKDISKILENIVYLHCKKLGYTVRVGNIGDKEVDFVLQSSKGYAYIQVAYMLVEQDTKEREFGNLISIQDGYPKYLVSMDPYATDYKGIKHITITDFLKMETLE